MYRLLIAEDEPLERDALLEVLRDSPVVGEVRAVENGRQAVDLAESFDPDICLLDIKMPGLDGMDAARAIRSRKESVQIIFLTAFEQFEYARQALRLRASEFLVKPAEDREVLDAVGRAARTLGSLELAGGNREELHRRLEILTPLAQRQLTERLFAGEEDALPRLSELIGSRREVRALLLRLRPPVREQVNPVEGRQRGRMRRLQSALLAAARECGYHGVASLGPSELRLALLPREERVEEALLTQLAESLAEFRRREGAIPRGILTPPTSSSGELTGWVTRASLALGEDVTGEGLYQLDSVERRGCSDGEEYELERDLLAEIRRGEAERIRELGQRLLRLGSSRKLLGERLAYLSHSLRLRGLEIPEEHSGTTIGEAFLSALEELRRRHHEGTRVESSPAVERTREYIHRHYMEELTLDRLAETAGISEYHLSRLFKRETGKTVVSYITDERLRIARELLAEGSLSVKEVSARSGFGDPSYFSRVFLRREGVSPTDFRRRGVTP